MTRSSLGAAKPQITEFLDGLHKTVFRRSELAGVLLEHKGVWDIATSVGVEEFIKFLVSNGQLKKVVLRFPSRQETRYAWRQPNIYELGLSMKPRSYLTHHTAAYLHGLVEREPTCLYVNVEQGRKQFQPQGLTQEAIDLAMTREPRVSHNSAVFGRNTIFLLNGMCTGQYQVIERTTEDGTPIRLTSVERTLVDMTVRPIYSGGVQEALNAYRLAVGRVSVTALAETLEQAGYVYPYTQAVGFYLERAGSYDADSLSSFMSEPRQFDFYLAHRIRVAAYSDRWRIYYPTGLK